MKPRIQEAVNDQLQAEFVSAYLYLGLAAYFEEHNLSGFAHWLRLQWEEETAHAMKFYDFLLRRGGSVKLRTLEAPRVEVTSPTDAFEQVLAHERHITERIHRLYELAREEHDYPLQTLLHWFIDEQVEEEENAQQIIEDLQRIGGDGPGLFMMDRELSRRQPEADA